MLAYMYLRLASAYKSSKYRMIFLVKHIILVIHYCTASAVSKIWVQMYHLISCNAYNYKLPLSFKPNR